MRKFFHSQLSTIERFLSKFPVFSKPEKNSLRFLNCAQFLGAMNDNIYKLVLVFFLIGIDGPDKTNVIMSAVGAIFVIPFLLFSSMAGILADRLSKSRIVIAIKAFEVLIILGVIASFLIKAKWAAYTLLFMLATQSALFGPSKYGIIPELVPKNKVSKANGLITSFTYLAIIAGTFLASALTKLTNYNYVIVGCFCLLIAVIGFISSFGIQYTPPKGSKKKISLLFIRQIFHTLIDCKSVKHLQICIAASAFFLFIGAFTQLNIIPYAIHSLGLSEVAGGFLFLATALGIAFGAFLGGRASKSHVELGLACIYGLVISALFLTLGVSTSNLLITIGALFTLGIAGGNFIVPFDTFIQLFSPEKNRGHVIAATNFMSFVGVLFSSIAIYLFNEALGLSAASSFAIIGGINLAFTLFVIIRLSDEFLAYTSKKFLRRFYSIKRENFDLVKKTNHPMLMLEEGSFIKGWLLCGMIPNLHLIFPQYKKRRFPWFQNLFFSLHRIDSPQKFEELVKQGKTFMNHDAIPCICLPKKKPVPEKQPFTFATLFSRKDYEVLSVNIEKEGDTTLIRFSK